MSAARGLVRSLGGRFVAAVEGPDGPRLAWTLRAYPAGRLRGDVLGGLTVAALIVPLSIGYAGVAGLPPEVGLYASLLPLVAYAIFGSARTLVVGPDASTAALIAATIVPLAATSDDRVRLASALALLVAAVFVAARAVQLGFLADFLSRPILVGYLAGVGITVAIGQVSKILGGPAFEEAFRVLAGIDWTSANPAAVADAVAIAVGTSGADLASAVIGIGAAALVLVGRRISPRIPWALIAMLAALAASVGLDLQARGVQVLGPVPGGLPPVGIPTASFGELVALLPGALGLALLSFADTTATGRSFAARRGERVDANRELVALGAADAAAALTSGYAVSSSPSRTSAAEEAGSTSQLAGLVAAVALAVVLLLLMPPLAALPIPALGGVIFVSVLGLIDIAAMRSIFRLRRSEGVIAFVAMAGVIAYGTLNGVVIAALLAALNIVRRAAWPQIAEEGRLPDGSWRDLERIRATRRVAGVGVIRFTGPLFFANASALRARVGDLVAERPDVRAIVVDLAATADVDVTAGDALRELAADLERGGRRLAVARPIGRIRDELRAYGLGGLMDATGGSFGSIDDAVSGLGLDPAAHLEEGTARPAEGPAPAEAGAGAPGAEDRGERPAPGATPEAAGAGRAGNVALRVVGVGLAVVVGAGLLAAVLAVSRGGIPPSGPEQVPNLVGMSLDRATTAARDAGFLLVDPIYARRDDRPPNTVVDQDPPAGTLADAGAEIQPLVSTGRQLVLVPDVTGESEGTAIARLTGVGLTVLRGEPVSDAEIPAGAVVSTRPPPLTEVATGTTVTYVVSAGPEPSPGP